MKSILWSFHRETPTTDLPLNITFHGAIDSTAVGAPDGTFATAQSIKGSLRASVPEEYTITVTAPGLLTVETTGSTDTIGMLDANDGSEVAPGRVR